MKPGASMQYLVQVLLPVYDNDGGPLSSRSLRRSPGWGKGSAPDGVLTRRDVSTIGSEW
jgi:hypothetical protein